MKNILLSFLLLLSHLSFSQFVPAKQLFVDSQGSQILIFDYNVDQLDDIILNFSYLIARENYGNGTFPQEYELIPSSEQFPVIEIVDIDLDNDLDFIGLTVGKVSLFENNEGRFTETNIISGTTEYYNSVSPGDFDNDGDVDLFISVSNVSPSIYYFENFGDKIFSDPVLWLINTSYDHNIKTVDFNKDGLSDIAAIEDQKVKLYLNKGGFKFDTLLVGSGIMGDSSNIHITDIDLDGDNDFVQIALNNVFVYEQIENNIFSSPIPLIKESYFVNEGLLMDKEGDGDQDIVILVNDFFDGLTKLLYINNQGDGMFAAPVNLHQDKAQYNLAKLDINQDSLDDLIFTDHSTFYWAENSDRKINTISGKVYYDKNFNCLFDEGDVAVKGVVINAAPGPFHTITDQFGEYKFRVDTGSYTISSLFNIPENKFVSYCNDSQEIVISQPGSVISDKNFGVQIKECPELDVSISSTRRRRCFSSSTTVTYSNTGTATAEAVKIKVVYPEYVKVISSTSEYSVVNDSLFTFEIGSLEPGQTGSISIIDSVVCGIEDIRGLAQCTKAHITTTTICTPEYIPDGWDKSSISVSGSCKPSQGLVVFEIKNGDDSGGMTDSSSYRVFYNDTLVYNGRFKLNAGEILPVSVPAYGQTVRLEADQHPFHPGKSRPREIIEACGSSFANARMGFFITVPQDDINHDVDISCMEIIDSYDPNDKLAEPSGFGPSNYIFPGERIEYTIRFQNTGSDTAYKVIVVDTLFSNYDISSLKILGASHNYNLAVTGSEKPILRWVFNNIMLPDSTTNEPASNGFVKFEIRSEELLPEGTLLKNFADIFFDYNSPVRTNTFVHEINYFIPEDKSKGFGITESNVITTLSAKSGSQDISVFPNPFKENVIFMVKSTSPYTIKLFSSSGELVKVEYDISSSRFKFEKGVLGKGIYLYKISSEKDGVIATGKIVAVD